MINKMSLFSLFYQTKLFKFEMKWQKTASSN